MRFYRIIYHDDGGRSAGFEWFTNKLDAEVAARHWQDNHPDLDSADIPEVYAIDIEPTKAGILRALERFASHPDNG